MNDFNDDDWSAPPPSRGPLFPVVVPHQEPVNWRNEIVNNRSWYEDRYLKINFNRALQDDLVCSFCDRSLAVGPIYYEETSGKKLYRMCGRCSSRSDLASDKQRMLRDHVYEQLIPHFAFECSFEPCDQILLPLQVEDHERRCSHRWKFQEDWHALNKLHSVDERYFVTLPEERSLRNLLLCEVCARPLSVFPVFSNGTVFICGRCNSPKESGWTKQMVYEGMAAYMKFPCAHQGCTQLLKKGEVEDHEKICRWENMQCPLQCGQFPKILEMSLHVRSNAHRHESISNRLKMQEQTVLFKIEDEPYIVSVEAVQVVDAHQQQQKLSCAAYGLDDKEYGNLCLEIVDGDNESVLESLQIKVAKLTTQKLHSTDRVAFKSCYPRNAFLRLLDAESMEGDPLDDESSDVLECKICVSYMTRLIYMCENRHPICDRCKPKVNSCPMCRGELANDRHLELEKQAAKLKFPCANNDCQMALTPKFLVRHEVRCCSKSERDDGPLFAHCWFDGCAISFLSYQFEDYLNHCAEQHRSSVICQGGKQTLEWTTEDSAWLTDKRVLFFDGQSFFIELDYGDGVDFVFKATQLVANSKVYKYTVEFEIDGLIVERKGTCHVPSTTIHPEDVIVNLNDMKGLLNKVVNAWQSVSLITYRVKFEENLQLAIDQ